MKVPLKEQISEMHLILDKILKSKDRAAVIEYRANRIRAIIRTLELMMEHEDAIRYVIKRDSSSSSE